MTALIVGADGGLGSAVKQELMLHAESIFEFQGDIQSDDAIRKNVFSFTKHSIDWLIYCAGVNRIAKAEDVTRRDFFESMDVNCFGFFRLIQHLFENEIFGKLPMACLVTSNAANIPMSHSLSYNCSKAAANMMVRQMAREIPADKLCIFGVAPNKLRGTSMSMMIEEKVCEMRGWTPEQAEAYQLAALPAKKETEVMDVASFIVDAMFRPIYYPWVHGTIIPFGGPQ